MAVISEIKCRECGETKEVAHSVREPFPKICNDCKQKKTAMTLEERINQLEKRLDAIEGKNAPIG